MKQPRQIEIKYQPIDYFEQIDHLLRALFEALGYENWASGFNVDTGWRDLSFSLKGDE